MPIVATDLVQQNEVLKRAERLRELFISELEVARIDHRIAQDWSGDPSLFIDVVLKNTAPPASLIARLSEEIGSALLRVVRSEELGFHAYLNFSSPPQNG